MAEIRALLLKYRVVFFRDQDITREQHVAFARRFGELEDIPWWAAIPTTRGWFRSTRPGKPAHATELVAHRCHLARKAAVRLRAALRRMPTVGGDTMWVNMVEAYRQLPADIKAQIAPLRARHGMRRASARRCLSRSAWR